jgi:cysteine-rich repeat protein
VDFYSAPLSADGPALTTADRGGARLWIVNPGASAITVTCAATFADYDATTGTETAIVATPFSGNTVVPALDVSECVAPATLLPASYTVPDGHLLKLTLSIHFVVGTAAELAYNAAPGDPGDTVGRLPENRLVSWPFGAFTDCGDGTVDPGEDCDAAGANGASTSCCTATCTFVAAATTCRVATGTCDVAEACTGAAGACPADLFVTDGTGCSDGNACTESDACASGACVGGPPPNCDDSELCTTDGCNPGTGCTNVDNALPCNDGNLCTVGDVCSGGTCAPGAPMSCPDDQCNVGSCAPGTGDCTSTPVLDGTGCDDTNVCTITDTCQSGACVGTGSTCGDTVVQGVCGEQCDDGGTIGGDGCSATCQLEVTDGCPNAPLAGCRLPIAARKAQLRMKDTAPAKDYVQWKWGAGDATTRAELGAPILDTDYTLCMYDAGALISTTQIPAGGTCSGKPCWKSNARGFQYKNKLATPDGVLQLKLKSGEAGKAQIQVKLRGANVEMPTLGPSLGGPVVVQMLQSASPTCWQAVFPTPFTKNDGVNFSDKND